MNHAAHHPVYNTKPIRYYLTVTELESLTTTTSGNIEAPKLEAEHFSIRVKSSGDVQVEALYADHLEVVMSSSGNVTITDGEVEEQDITISSSGDYNARELECQRAKVKLSSSGNATLYVVDKLEADLSSSGDVYYTGDPIVATTPTSSTGRVKRIL